jgi:hypothetical protein
MLNLVTRLDVTLFCKEKGQAVSHIQLSIHVEVGWQIPWSGGVGKL